MAAGNREGKTAQRGECLAYLKVAKIGRPHRIGGRARSHVSLVLRRADKEGVAPGVVRIELLPATLW
jgi:hypothetical protein